VGAEKGPQLGFWRIDDRTRGSVANALSTVWYGEGVKNKRLALFRGRHFQDEIIVLCLRWYLRYSLSYRDLEEMMAERGLSLDYSTGTWASILAAWSEVAHSILLRCTMPQVRATVVHLGDGCAAFTTTEPSTIMPKSIAPRLTLSSGRVLNAIAAPGAALRIALIIVKWRDEMPRADQRQLADEQPSCIQSIAVKGAAPFFPEKSFISFHREVKR
jgi:hypothetical protein